jgi:thiol-disulfide isomerase/thioredoxin
MIKKQSLVIFALLAAMLLSGCSDQQAAEASLLDIQGERWNAEQMQGKWLVINYWAIWCGPCRDEIPELNHFAQQYDDKALVFAVNFDGVSGEKLVQQSEEMGIEFISLASDPATWFELKPSQVLPVTHIIDPQGNRVDSLIGPQTVDSLRQAIEKNYAMQ